ncbi:MAG: AraC family transcriptional regulator [Candidatus Magasanikbacteria bacterium]|nr:AraC family transcriptional regulator [Candidatus Magasanikbacteria bacterium]
MHLPRHPAFAALRKYNFPPKDFAVFGSGQLWVRGIRKAHDLDILARGAAWQKALKLGEKKLMIDSGHEYVRLTDGNNGVIEIFNKWVPGEWNENELIDSAEMIDGVPFVPLEKVIIWKRRMNREKDRIDLKLISAYLKIHQPVRRPGRSG